MEAGKNPKLSLKSLSQEINIIRKDLPELKYLKEKIINLEKRLDISEEKVKCLEEKILKKQVGSTKDCNRCDKVFDSEKNLKLHIAEIHTQRIQCSSCEKSFHKNYELESHIKTFHKEVKEYECDKCEKKFVLNWRLKKHKNIHTNGGQSVKSCHYFNNKKECPFENIGCMFAHVQSIMCKYNKACRKKLCSFRPDLVQKDNESTEIICDEDTLKEAFENLNDDEQYESKEVLCDAICTAPNGYHKCWTEGQDRFGGCDLTKYKEDFDKIKNKLVKSFPCEKCDDKYEQWENLRQHFIRTHGKNVVICCPVKDCEFESKSVDILIMHIGVHHKDLVRKRI